MTDEAICFVQCGRAITRGEVDAVCSLVWDLRQLARRSIAEAVCEQLGWFTASGNYKLDAGRRLLERLESEGIVELPEKRAPWGNPSKGARIKVDSEITQPEISGALADIGPVDLAVVTDRAVEAVWNDCVARHHYLGYSRPIGCFLRYFVTAPRHGVLGCILLAGAARAIHARDEWIGWSRGQRLRNLAWVINNSRFLILPWVRVAHLASHVLGQLSCRVADDWEGRWGYRPVLVETFVDPSRYRGTCYKASNWEYLGETTGEGLARRGRAYRSSPKGIFVKPLIPGFRKTLCAEHLMGRVWE